MKTRLEKISLAILLLCAFSLNSSAAIITIGIEAVVTGVTDNDNLLEGKVTVGSIITGTYTYDTSTADTNPLPTFGEYGYSNEPYGIVLNAGSLTFQTNPANVDFTVGISNDFQNEDGYGVGSRNNLMLFNGTIVDNISWGLIDNLGTAISSTDLPSIPPDLSKWPFNNLYISGGVGGTAPCYEKTFGIGAEVTSAFLIPEPVSLLLFGFGLLTLRKPN